MNENLKSMYYFFPEQDPYTTPISERHKVLVANPKGWEQISRHLERTEREERILAEEKARKQYLKDGSYNMTKNWDNSIEKIRQRRLEEHKLRIQTKIEERMARFMEITREQEEERQKYIKNVKKRMFTSQEKQRNLNSALMLSETLYERNLQDAFNAKVQAEQKEEEAEYARKIFKDAEDALNEESQAQIDMKEKKKKYQNELMTQIKTREDKRKKEFEKERAAEIIDNELALKELEEINQFEKDRDRAQKMATRKMILDFKKVQERVREEELAEDRLVDQINDIYNRAKCDIDEKKKAKILELHEERLKLRDNTARLVQESIEGLEEEEEARLDKAAKEKEELQDKREEKQRKYQERLKQERLESRKQWLKEEFEKKQKQHELDKLAYLNRLKTVECVKMHEIEKVKEDKLKRKQYAKELKEQMDENQMKINAELDEKAGDLKIERDILAKTDKKFFAYADEVYDLAKTRGRMTYPIERVIEKYKYDTGMKRKVQNVKRLVPIVNEDNTRNILFSRRRFICDVNTSTLVLE